MNEDLEGALKAYLHLMNSKEYFDAHEVLEEAWHPLRLSKHPLQNLVKGLINGAIAFEHIRRNSKNASLKASKVIASFERHKHLSTEQIQHATLFTQACQKVEALKKEFKVDQEKHQHK